MRYFPNNPSAQAEMLKQIGVSSAEELFSVIPASIKLDQPLKISGQRSEYSLLKELSKKAADYPSTLPSFLGGGVYRRFIPSAIAAVTSRAEFLTAYTPYQPELSQGTLQAMFEFQSLLAKLTGMEVANGSMYEGASACAEAVMMASRINPKGKKVLVSAGLHPEYHATLKTYLSFGGLELIVIPLLETGQTDLSKLEALIDEDTLASVLQVINFFGVIEDQARHAAIIDPHKAINIAVITDMTALGLMKPPGDYGADILVGEGQSLGLPLSYGGPNLGVFACKSKYMRKMPGRLSGMSEDVEGNRAFCLTLSTREQHIRREKATSNICSNQAHCALSVTLYLTLLGEQGIRSLARLNMSLAHYAISQIATQTQLKLRYSGKVYNEFVLELPCNATDWLDQMLQEGLLAGIDLSRFDPTDEGGLLVSLSETNSKEDIDFLMAQLKVLS